MLGKVGESSYLKVHISHEDKICTIVNNELVIATKDGIAYHIDIQAQGKFFDTDNTMLKKFELF